MGAMCCCFRVDDVDVEEQLSGNRSILRHHASFNFLSADFLHSVWVLLICLSLLAFQIFVIYRYHPPLYKLSFENPFSKCSTLFRRMEVHPNSSSAPVAFSVALAVDDSACDTYRSPPRPLAYDDPRCHHLNRQVIISMHEKASSHCHEDPDTLRSKGAGVFPVGTEDNSIDLEKDEGYEPQRSESSVRKPSEKVFAGMLFTFTSSEDEDTCPICLEEYTPENPCITMQCSHEYHLGCIYEWMERSENCPICGKVMLFEEAA